MQESCYAVGEVHFILGQWVRGRQSCFHFHLLQLARSDNGACREMGSESTIREIMESMDHIVCWSSQDQQVPVSCKWQRTETNCVFLYTISSSHLSQDCAPRHRSWWSGWHKLCCEQGCVAGKAYMGYKNGLKSWRGTRINISPLIAHQVMQYFYWISCCTGAFRPGFIGQI